MKDDGTHSPGARVLVGGGIGAGKSSVVDMFRNEGFRAISADEVGRTVLQPGTPAHDEVAKVWPDAVEGGELDRSALAAIVFADRDELSKLEAITHPEISRRILAECDAHPAADIVIETPVARLMGGRGFFKVAVLAPRELRLARAVTRGAPRDDVMARMGMQPAEDEWRDWADRVIDNTGSPDETERQVAAIVEELRRG